MIPAHQEPLPRAGDNPSAPATVEDQPDGPAGRTSASAVEEANRALRTIVGATLIVMSGFVASKVLGLIRNIVISHQYGASRDYEVFLVAISVPDTVFQVLAGGAVGAAFIPVFASYWTKGDQKSAWRLTSSLMNIAAVSLGGIALLLMLVAPQVMGVLVPGWPPDDRAHAAALTQIMLICPAIFAVSTLATSGLNAIQRFALASAAPLAYNLALIAAALFFRSGGAEALAIGAVVGALLHLGVQVPGLLVSGMRYTRTFGLDMSGTREVARLMVPRMIGLGVSQLNQLINVALASFLVRGSIAYLNYAWLLLMVPLGVFAMALSTAVFPTLAQQSADSETEKERETFLFGLRTILYLTVPAAVGLAVLGRPIVGLLLERGEFTSADAASTAFALGWFAIGLPGHSVIEIVARVFYAERDTTTPVKIAAGAVALNVGLSLILMRTDLSFGGLALANSVAALTEASLLTAALNRKFHWIRLRDLFDIVWRIGLASAALAVMAMLIQGSMALVVDPLHWTGRIAIIGVTTVVSGGVYVGVAHLLGVQNARQALRLIRQR